jgi:ribosomal protein L29
MKYKEITKMSKEDREKKLKDLKIELIKSKTKASKTGSSNTKEIKKTIAKILTFNVFKEGIGKK